MSVRSLLAAAVVAMAAVSGARAHAGSFSADDWTVVCDNIRRCTAFGFPVMDHPAFLKIERDGAARADPRLTVAVAEDEFEGQAWTLSVDGQAMGGALMPGKPGELGYSEGSLNSAQVAALMPALANGAELGIQAANGARISVSLAGSSAALRWMDDQQKRAGTVTALVARGPKPAAQVPMPPEPPVVSAGPIPSQNGLAQVLPKSVRAKFPDDCDKDLPEDQRDPIIARLSPGVVLWGDVCSVAAYQSSYVMFLADEKGRNPRPLVLTNAEGRALEFPDIGFEFDPSTLTLANFYKGRGLADCGGSASWVWDGKAFRLTEATVMDLCRGLQPESWPASYVSRSK